MQPETICKKFSEIFNRNNMDSIQEKIFDSLRNKGINAFNNGNYKEAVDSFGKALELDPKNAELFYLKGNALMCLKQFMEAIKIYNLAIEYKPDFDNAFFKRALAKKENKDRVGAKDDLQKVLKINPNHFECKYELENIVKIEEESNIFGEFVDPRDNQKYRTVRIGEQIWMLDYLRFETTKKSLFGKKTFGCWTYHDSPMYLEQYGRLYSYEVAEQAIQEGWRLPSIDDFIELFGFTSGLKHKVPNYLFSNLTNCYLSGTYGKTRKSEFEQIVQQFHIFKLLAGYKSLEKYEDMDESSKLWLNGGRILDIYRKDLYENIKYYKEEYACSILCIKK